MENETTIGEFLKLGGVYPNLQGFHLLVDAVKFIKDWHKKETKVCPITKLLYPSLAKKINSSVSKVERAIRHAISKIPGHHFRSYGMLPYPANSELIYFFAMGHVFKKKENNQKWS